MVQESRSPGGIETTNCPTANYPLSQKFRGHNLEGTLNRVKFKVFLEDLWRFHTKVAGQYGLPNGWFGIDLAPQGLGRRWQRLRWHQLGLWRAARHGRGGTAGVFGPGWSGTGHGDAAHGTRDDSHTTNGTRDDSSAPNGSGAACGTVAWMDGKNNSVWSMSFVYDKLIQYINSIPMHDDKMLH